MPALSPRARWSEPICIYCRAALSIAEALECARPRCGARYHSSCWTECRTRYGSCAVLGCGAAVVPGPSLFRLARACSPSLLPGCRFWFTLAILLLVLWFLVACDVVGPRYRIVDPLANAAMVTTWTETGLVFEGGSYVFLPGVKRIVGSASTLERLVADGVDIQPSGRLGVRVRFSSGCGNCNRGWRERRFEVDLSALLVFMGLAEPDASIRLTDMDWKCLNPDRGDVRGFVLMGKELREVEKVCEENGIPIPLHAEPELAGLW